MPPNYRRRKIIPIRARRKKKPFLGIKARNLIAVGAVTAAGLLAGRAIERKPFVPPPIIIEKRIGHAQEDTLTLRDYHRGSLGHFFNPRIDTTRAFFRSAIKRDLHQWIWKNRKKEWQDSLKAIIPEKRYREAIVFYPERDTDWLTSEQVRRIHNILNKFQMQRDNEYWERQKSNKNPTLSRARYASNTQRNFNRRKR